MMIGKLHDGDKEEKATGTVQGVTQAYIVAERETGVKSSTK